MNKIANDILQHYGTEKHSGRYPWGSGKNPYQHSGDFLSRVEELKKQGLSEAQIAEAVGLSTTHLRIQKSMASSERREQEVATAKSLRELYDTLQEAAGSGWSKSFQIMFGDFEEAKELFTNIGNVVGGFIDRMSDARNEVLQFWHDNGGRAAIIDGIANAFDGLLSIIKPITEAFRQIFPPMTGEKLVAISEGFRDLTAKFKIGDETADKIKRTFAGLFAVVDILGRAFGFLFGKAASLVGVLAPGAGGILDFTAKIGDFIVKLDEAIRAGDVFNIAFDKVKNGILTIVAAIKDDINGLKDTDAFKFLAEAVQKAGEKIAEAFAKIKEVFGGWGGIDLSGLKSFTENAIKNFRPFTALGAGLSEAFGLIAKAWKKIQPVFSKIASVAGPMFAKLWDGIKAAFDNVGFKGIIDLVNGGLLAVLILGIKSFVDKLGELEKGAKGLFGSFDGMLGNITGVLDGVKNSLEAYQASLKAKTLMTIATAIAVLAAALVVLSFIDGEKMLVAIGGITTLFAELSGSMILLGNSMKKGGGLVKASASMVTISIAILILSSALKKLSQLSWDEITKGTTAIGTIMGELLIFMNTVNGKKLISTGIAMNAMAVSMLIFASAIRSFGNLDADGIKAWNNVEWQYVADDISEELFLANGVDSLPQSVDGLLDDADILLWTDHEEIRDNSGDYALKLSLDVTAPIQTITQTVSFVLPENSVVSDISLTKDAQNGGVVSFTHTAVGNLHELTYTLDKPTMDAVAGIKDVKLIFENAINLGG
ncbi:hypothetical protein FACS189490_12280 [Clostridia bacterium]|nr:hypothetical protein FACS189490_12280 [Clostridia bacterium]